MYTAKRGYRPGDEPVPAYHLTKFLGRGQFGEVWQAKGPGGMQVALKIIDLGEREGLKEFAGLQKVKDIRHANLVEFVACWVKTDDGQVLDEVPPDPGASLSPRDSSIEIGGTMLFDPAANSPTRPVELIVAMSLGSKTLFRRLQEINQGKEQKNWIGIPDDELLRYMEEAAKGIDFLNRQGIIHGDIKPQNLLLVGDSVKVCDFGLAQAVDSLRKTQSGMGTVAYAAPELFEGKPNIQSDQYCLAVSYVELRTGALPFDEPNPFKVIELHRHGKLNLQNLTNRERSVIKRATEIKPDRRWPSCSEMVSKLRDSRQQDRSGKGGGWLSMLGGRSPPTERLPPVEEPITDETVRPGSGGKSGSKQDSGGAVPPKPDSGKKKSGPQPAAMEPRVVRTHNRRGDDTDEIAATVASGPLQDQEPEAPPRTSFVRRLAKVAVWMCLIGALAFGGYQIKDRAIAWVQPALKGGSGGESAKKNDDQLKQKTTEEPEKPTAETVKREYLAGVASGQFEKAAEGVAKAENDLSAAEHKKLCAAIRKEWSDPASNPVVRQLESDAIQLTDAACALEAAEKSKRFVELVGGVPESVWQAVRGKWTSGFEKLLTAADLEKAAAELTSAPGKLVPLAERSQLRTRIAGQWSKRFEDLLAKSDFFGAMTETEGALAKEVLETAERSRKRTQVTLAWKRGFQDLLASAKPDGPADSLEQALTRATEDLKKARTYFVIPEEDYPQLLKQVGDAWCKGVDHLAGSQWPEAKKLLDKAPEDVVPKADREKKVEDIQKAWDKPFNSLIEKAQWAAAKKALDSASEELLPQDERKKRLAALQMAWDAAFQALAAKGDLDTAEQMLAGAVSISLYPGVDVDKERGEAVREKRRQKWIADFDAAVKAEKWPVAVQMAASVPKGIPPDAIAKNLAVVAAYRLQDWDTGFNALVEKQDWTAAMKALDGASADLLPEQERAQRLARIQTAWDKGFQPLLDKGQWEAADQMVAKLPQGLFPQPETEKKLGLILERRRGKWVMDFDAQVAKPDWTAATKMLDSPPAGYFTAAEIQKKRAQIQASWDDAFKPLPAKGEWEAAKKMLAGAPAHLFGQTELDERLTRIQKPWSDAFEALLAKNDLDEAGKMLDQAARVELFPKPILEERRATLKDGEYRKWLAAFDKAFSELVDGGKFLEAKKKLDDAVARERLRSEGIQSRTKSLRKQWLQWIVAHWDKSDQAEKLKVEIAEFLKASPEPSEANDARLLRARALVHLGKQTSAEQTVSDARKDLLVLVEAAGLAPDRAYVRDALLVIASVNKPEDFRRTYPKEPENFAAPWQLDPWEKKELEGRPPPSPAMEPGSGIATIKKAIETLHDPQAKPDAARPLLEALEKSYPTASPGSWKVDQEDDLALLTGSVPAVLGKLAAGVAVVGPAKYPDQAKDLGRAKDWLLAAKSRFPVPEIGAAIHAVATRRLALRAWEEPKPRQADLQELEEWDQSSKGQAKAAADAEELMAKAWRAECNVVLGQNILSARNNLMLIKAPLLAKQPAYTRYLWCRALKAAGSGTDSIVQELNELAPALEGPEPILKAQDRAAAMAELIVEAAREQRKQFRPWKLEKIPFNSFSAPAEAEQYARLLKAAGKLVADENRQRELKLGLALAEFHGPKPEMARVWSLTRELLPLRDVGVEPDLVPLLFAGVSSFWQQPSPANLSADDPQFVAAVGATTQLLRELGKDEAGKMTKEGPKAVYDSVLKPLLEGPEFQKKTEAQKQAGNQHLSELAGAVAQLLENQQDAQWPLPKGVRSVHHAIESQATLAIELAPKDKPDSARLADYYAMRAGARAYKPDLNVPEVLGDVETALKHQPKLHRALGVRAYALIMRAGEQPKRDQILRDLTDAIAAGEEAVKSCPEHNKAYPLHMLNLGSAHLTLGNYVTDAKKKQEHLGKARDCASQAAKLVHEYADDARLLLGNIYEDLASQVGQDPKKNYLEAKKWFSEALQRNPLSAQALCSLARCSFKAVVKSRLNPRELDLGDRDAALAACLKDLDKATKYALKDAIRIEAFSYLGQVYEEQGDWARADENIGKAAELAKQSEASTRAAYVAAWAMLPVTQASRLQATRTADDPEVMKLFQTAEQRAKELQGMPAGAFVVPAKQVAVILGATRQRRKEFDKAAEAYDQALPKDLAETDALDVSLLLARADCNLSRPGANKEAAFAQAAIRDASRALELAPAGPEQAGAHYRLALAHFSLFGQGGNPAIQHRDKSLESIREAVRLAPLGANGVTYRKTGATLIANVIAEVAKADPKQAIPFYEEAERWLKEALDLVQDPAEKKAIEAILKLFQDVLGKLRGGPAPAPTPKSGE